MSLMNGLFAVVTLGVFGFFGFNILKLWRWFHIGAAPEETRTDNLAKRLFGVVVGGFIQPRMFRDFIPGFMHALVLSRSPSRLLKLWRTEFIQPLPISGFWAMGTFTVFIC